MSEDTPDDPFITHMLGYLTPEQWADAIKGDSVDPDWAVDMMKIQERRYAFKLIPDVIAVLGKEWNGLGGVEVDFEEE